MGVASSCRGCLARSRAGLQPSVYAARASQDGTGKSGILEGSKMAASKIRVILEYLLDSILKTSGTRPIICQAFLLLVQPCERFLSVEP